MIHSTFWRCGFVMNLSVFIVLFILFPISYSSISADDSLDNYPAVCDCRNYKPSSAGGKGVKPQGRPLTAKSEHLLFGKSGLDPLGVVDVATPWRYMVTMNCKNGSTDLVDLVTKLASQLLPPEQRHRLAILIGINEKIGSTADLDTPFNWGELETKRTEFEALGVPILFVYTPWSTYRDGPQETTPESIIRNIRQLVNTTPVGRVRDVLTNRVEKEDSVHGFPFGAMRTHLLNNDFTKDFITKFSRGKPVYFHIQDSDFTNLKTSPQFYNFGVPTEAQIVSDTEQYLYSNYDSLISAMCRRNGHYPVIIGGAHVYDPAEILDVVSISAKQWTRFSSEMGNIIKHILAVFQPYGVYFHEPNTMCLAPQTVEYLYGKTDETPLLFSRLKHSGITFGIDSEVQGLTRSLFENMDDSICRNGMPFSSMIVLATSMKRTGRPFNIRFSGAYDEQLKKFKNWKSDDIVAIHGMPQEIFKALRWSDNVATSFSEHRKEGRRTLLSTLFSAFDPHALTGARAKYAASGLYETLVGYDAKITEQKQTIKDTFQNLLAAYDKLGQGKLTAFYMLSAAWESGQAMRIMFLDNLIAPVMPARRILTVPALLHERKLLADRLNYRVDRGHPFPNPFIITLLDLDSVPRRMPTSDMFVELVKSVRKHTKTKKKTSEILGVSTSVINKILETESVSPATLNKFVSILGQEDINTKFPEIPVSALEELVRKLF